MLYLVSPGGVFIMDAGRGNFVLRFTRTQENAFLDAFLKNFVFMSQIYFCSAEEWRAARVLKHC